MRILVSGGGTGGHISPVLAVISELNKQHKDIEILYVGSKEGLENKIVPQTGIEYVGISAGKFRRYHKNMLLNLADPTTLFKNARDLFRFGSGFFEAREIVKSFDPDVVFTKGGFVSLPVGLAASTMGHPLVIHESDSIMGLSNKILAKRAEKICISYPEKFFPEFSDEQLVYSGNPIREDISGGDVKRARNEFQLVGERPVLMIIGGSQGALVINKTISDALDKLLKKYEIIHISGERDYDWLQYSSSKIDPGLKKYYHLHNFLSGNLKDAYAVSDLVISRAGNNVISELSVLGKPTILIPLGSSANNHQVENARILSRMGAAIMMPQDHLTPQKMMRQIDLLFETPEDLEDLGKKIKELAKTDAAKIVAQEIIKIGEEFSKECDEQEG